ncbi:hypothetical protein C0Q70_19236 [Pomacea canaliculata]|uniref:Uncharacterized protein n=2 Tax=Pomacea canaliculata TaxID=400727 RepID=A0A2T7NIR7_POMCA|nr:hypothetical protein C0Q70_19236 [Pomacea canaliculata]
MQFLEEKADMEKALKESILKFQYEIESLQRTNVELRQEKSLESHEKMKERISELELSLKDANLEIKNLSVLKEQLELEVTKQKKIQLSDMCQIQHLQNVNLLLNENIQEISQKNTELVYKLENFQREAHNDCTEKEQAKLIEKLRNKMEELVKEKELALLEVSKMNEDCEEARAFQEVVQKDMKKLEDKNAEMKQMCGQLIAEIELLRKKLKREESPSFKEFISMKREIIAVRNENESLRQKMQTPSCALPVLKEDMGSLKQDVLTKKGKKKLLATAFDQRSENAKSD